MLHAIPPTLARIDESVLIFMSIVIAAVIIMFTISSVRKVLETNARERTKREISAYVAEGTIQPDDAARLMATGTNEAEKMVLDGVAWGTVKPEKAEQLIRTLRSDRVKAEAKPAQA